MNTDILIRKHIQASNVIDAMKIIKKKFPFARMITYKFVKDFRFEDKKDYENRKINVVFVKDFRKFKGMI